jgi:signal transduction histidine kinase
LTQLVEDLLDVSRTMTGKMRLDVEPIDVTAVVRQAIDAVRPAADAKSIELQAMFDHTASWIVADANRLQQVAWNLLSNAVKFTPNGGSVRIAVVCVRDTVEIVVHDNGPGIEPRFLPFIFDRFRQGSPVWGVRTAGSV